MDQFIGEIRMFPWGYAPEGWIPCDGRLLNVSQYQPLFALLGNNFGGDGNTTFALPDLRGRVPMHCGSAQGLTPRGFADKGGSETVTLAEHQMAAHAHPETLMASEQGSSDSPQNNVLGKGPRMNRYANPTNPLVSMNPNAVGPSPVGGGKPHTNMQPFLALNFCISFEGIWPVRP